MNEEFVTIRQASKALKVPEGYIRELEKRGNVPGFKSGSRVYVALNAFREQLTRANVAQ